MIGKRFIFATFAIVCVSIVAGKLNYAGDIYLKLILAITVPYLGAQSLTDWRNGSKGA